MPGTDTLCDDCPPIGYETDKTRCLPCPRRRAIEEALAPIAKGLPGPLELSRMHEAELKRCYKQYGILGALISQIMVGRTITSMNSLPHEVTGIKLKDGKVQIYGKSKGRKRPVLICEGLGGVTIIEGAKP